jgi:hypothetical protein
MEIAKTSKIPYPQKLINEIISTHANRSYSFRTVDYQLVENLITNMEERTLSFKINNDVQPYNETLGRWYPGIDINFFYVGYLIEKAFFVRVVHF